ncbi:MAG: hypothetical protein IKE37_06050 [Firmicutes bacterium]|nr:hypothetical protein [Bacillota bacterium]
MKKDISITLVLVMLLSLAACGKTTKYWITQKWEPVALIDVTGTYREINIGSFEADNDSFTIDWPGHVVWEGTWECTEAPTKTENGKEVTIGQLYVLTGKRTDMPESEEIIDCFIMPKDDGGYWITFKLYLGADDSLEETLIFQSVDR